MERLTVFVTIEVIGGAPSHRQMENVRDAVNDAAAEQVHNILGTFEDGTQKLRIVKSGYTVEADS